ncbi:hypothetical protein LOTGIDRAFT_133340 [Lottia gigantea]|uniref:Glucose/Sorbosone dehydrogenase domain-containing protein n=1 Tax=Lottia gigantea TaxID=225164 RepID=V3YZA4_LOTGI|nr:hypothetical protein LOTGIDRAFT_133340 [Lottia gigantea]ESO83493.1 hypothetical protein LOTGIDRAFT_133340 [Lottia gigantea]
MAKTRQLITSIIGVLCIIFLPISESHPQCLDFKPPFKPKTNHDFCNQYSNFGCCSKSKDDNIQNTFNSLRSLVSEGTWNKCQGTLKDLMCQECSPYAAHIYGVEDTMGDNPFPGLCKNYCETLFDSGCMEITKLIDVNITAKVDLNDKTKFCNHVKLSDVDYCYPELLQNDMLNGNISNVQITSKGCLCLEPFFHNLRNPIFARSPPDGSNRLIIGEQLGIIYVTYPQDKDILQTPFLNISHKVKTTPREGDERGLFQIAFHPKFLSNNKFYIYYSTHLEEHERNIKIKDQIKANHKIRISEFVVSEWDENVADPSTERVILEVYEPYWNHNGGELIFGDDEYLYLFIGDGGNREDPLNVAQNKSHLLGKVLRINIDTGSDQIPYTIPSDNPFVGQPGARGEIYALGVRNIWRCGIDLGDRQTGSAGKGRIVCGDVGQDKFEEIDLITKGANFGWNVWEGGDCFNGETEKCNSLGLVDQPIYYYNHSYGKSVTGGNFYRGCENPNLDGLYIYGDFMSGRLFGLKQDNDTNEWKNKELFMCGPDICKNNLVGKYDQYIISFGEDENAEMYMLVTKKAETDGFTGNIYKIVDPIR